MLAEQLANLRFSAINQSWSDAQEALEELMQIIGFENALRSGISAIQRPLKSFEMVYPEITWPRESLKHISEVADGNETINDPFKLPPNNENFPHPGLNNFINAFENLWKAAGIHKYSYPEFVTNSISNGIMSQAIERWGKLHPKAWEDWIKSDDEQKVIQPLDFWNDPYIQQLIQHLWLEIASFIELQIKRDQ